MKQAWLPLWLLTATFAGLVSAQTRPPTAPAPTPAPAPTQPGVPAAAAPNAAGAAAEPPLPNVDDPMLAPPPAPKQVLTSWQQALKLIRDRSPELRGSRWQTDVAKARVRQARGRYLPRLTGSADITRDLVRPPDRTTVVNGLVVTQSFRPQTTWQASLGLDVPLFAPQAWYDHGTAEANVDATRLDTKEVERRIVAEVANAIVIAVRSERLAEVTRVNLRSALSTLDLNKRRAALGASSMLDVLRAEHDAQTARAQVVAADEQLLQDREALGIALSSPEGYGVTSDISMEALASDARTVCRPEQDVRKRPDVVAATADVDLAARGAGSADRTFWPTINANSRIGYTGEFSPNDEQTPFWTVGASLNWVIYDGGIRYGQRDEAEASTLVAKEQRNDTLNRAELEVVQARRAVQVAEANLQVSARARDIAAETARLARVAFLNGSGTSFDLVDTAKNLRNAELDLAIKQFDVLRARVAALLALASCNV